MDHRSNIIITDHRCCLHRLQQRSDHDNPPAHLDNPGNFNHHTIYSLRSDNLPDNDFNSNFYNHSAHFDNLNHHSCYYINDSTGYYYHQFVTHCALERRGRHFPGSIIHKLVCNLCKADGSTGKLPGGWFRRRHYGDHQ